MNPSLQTLLNDVATARSRYIDQARPLTRQQAEYKPAPDVWSVTENTEHLFWAEQGGIWGMWRAWQAHQAGSPVWTGDRIHHGRSIEDIVALTWQPKEQVPAVAAPRLGGPLGFWITSLDSLQQPLEAFARHLTEEDLEVVIHPHPISGPLNIRQRLEFLRFHIDRHRRQVNQLFT